MASLREIIQRTHRAFDAAGIPDARLEAEVLVMSLMRLLRHDIFANQETEVGFRQEQDLAAMGRPAGSGQDL